MAGLQYMLLLVCSKATESKPMTVSFRPFLIPISITDSISAIQIDKSVDGFSWDSNPGLQNRRSYGGRLGSLIFIGFTNQL